MAIRYNFKKGYTPKTYRRDRTSQLVRYGAAAATSIAVVVAFFYQTRNQIIPLPPYFKELVLGIVVSMTVVVVFTSSLLRYLNRDASSSRDEIIYRVVSSASKKAADLAAAEAAKKTRDSFLNANERDAIVAEIRSDMQTQAGDTLVKLIQNLQAKSEVNEQERALRSELDDTIKRLNLAIYDLKIRANLNLVFGILITLGGVIMLLYLILTSPVEDDWLSFTKTYVPRLTVAILVEIFAYFFLNLYKASLSETRYFHNEITNLSARRVAVSAALTDPARASMDKVIAELLKTERNGTLTKSQTTVELAKAQLEAENSKSLAGTLSTLLEALVKTRGHIGEKD
jgi:hypothetical protein